MSLHPPHLIDSGGSPTPAALIPFCAYQTNMTLLGQTRPDLPFIICSKFQTTILEGQLCYSLNISTLSRVESQAGLEYGLLLMLDPGQQEQIKIDESEHQNHSMVTSLNLKALGDNVPSFWVHLNTMNRFGSYSMNRAGSYGMTNLKKMTGTESFMDLSDQSKGCTIQALEFDCPTKNYIEQVLKKCDCLPPSLKLSLKREVYIDFYSIYFYSINYSGRGPLLPQELWLPLDGPPQYNWMQAFLYRSLC